jgi:hypothetical protein
MKLAWQREMSMRVPSAEWLAVRGVAFCRVLGVSGLEGGSESGLGGGFGIGWNGLRGIRPGPKGPPLSGCIQGPEGPCSLRLYAVGLKAPAPSGSIL